MARIERFTSTVEAELVSGLLRAHGFRAYVASDDAGGLHPELPYGLGRVAVVVPDEDLADALALLDSEAADVDPQDEGTAVDPAVDGDLDANAETD